MFQVYRTEINHIVWLMIYPYFIVLEKDGVAMLPGFWLYCGQQIPALGKQRKCENGGSE